MIVEPLVQRAVLVEREAHGRGEPIDLEAAPEVTEQRPEPGLVGGLGEGDVREVVHRRNWGVRIPPGGRRARH